LRALGGTMYLAGVLMMVYNLWKTAKVGNFLPYESAEAPARVVHQASKNEYWHKWIERRPMQMLIASAIVILIGGIVEIFPMMMIDSNVPKIESVKPYTALELEGRDIYIREGCVGCHSQMVRPFRSEVVRYDPEDLQYSLSGEYIYDRPFLWGSKRTGPDLHRIGGKYSDSWHYNHMLEPTSTSPGSIMPPYPWLADKKLDFAAIPVRVRAAAYLGAPYSERELETSAELAKRQAAEVASSVAQQYEQQHGRAMEVDLADKQMIALIAYLQRLGTDIFRDPPAEGTGSTPTPDAPPAEAKAGG